MVFSSIVFILYFLPLLLAVYYLADIKYKNAVLLAFSIAFYSWGAPQFIFVIIGTTLLDYYLVKWIWSSENESKRKLLLVLSVGVNLSLLFYFKYCNFFIDNINELLSLLGIKKLTILEVVLPIGISFYTFETITYVVDVFRKIHKPLDKFSSYLLYILLFPKLIAGPIIRYHDIGEQLEKRALDETANNFLTGLYRFIIGLSKKVLIANQVGIVADEVFNLGMAELGTTNAWIGILAYTLQIYFDFSGYSDMAIGLSAMFGFRIKENFDNPYISSSITEFWRRWHISLGNWMRNYLYIPLGGNKVDSSFRIYSNLWIVFLASGLWHGAAWNFVVWGVFHGSFLVAERMFLQKLYKKLPSSIVVLSTFIIVMIGWVFFRSESLTHALHFLSRMFSINTTISLAGNTMFWITIAFALFFSFWGYFSFGQQSQQFFYRTEQSLSSHLLLFPLMFLLLIICISFIAGSGFNPFIYFRF